MKKLFVIFFLVSGNVGAQTIGQASLDTTQVVTAGTPVTAAAAGTVFKGCWIQNDPSRTTNIVVDTINVANFLSPSSTAATLLPGQVYNCPGGLATAVTVDSGDNNHKFFGVKY